MTGGHDRKRDSAADDLWLRTLTQIPSVYGRLVYMGSLRDANTDRYQHHGLAARYSEDAADDVLRHSHSELFQGWLAMPLREQKDDIDGYLSSLNDDKRLVVETWLRVMPYRTVVPASARAVETDLFLSDFRILLELLKNEYGAAAPDRGA